MIKFTSVSFTYPQSPRPVFKDVHLEIIAGTLTLVTGASGSGKSTFLRCINGLVPHFSGGSIAGRIDVFGSDPVKEGPEIMAKKIGFVFQEPETQFVFDLVEDEIAFPLENMGLQREEMHTRVDQVLRILQLTPIRKKKVHELSGGEQQKVAIASALVSQPDVLILDEPTSQLDPVSADEVMRYIVSLKKNLNLTILISEHRLERLLPYIDNIAYLTPTHSMLFGTPQSLLPQMQQVPPIIEIAKYLKLSPLPLKVEDFPDYSHTNLPDAKQDSPQHPPSRKSPILEVDNLSVKISNQQILSDISLQVREGEIVVIMGPNGSGKTTLLRSMLGFVPATGDRKLFGQSMADMNLATIVQQVAYLPQNPSALLFAETVLEELNVTLRNHQLSINEFNLSQFLNKFGLYDKRHRYPRDLSVGERQRTALAAITVHQPRIILLDEPTRGLDTFAKYDLSNILHKWCSLGKAVLLVTHDVEFAATLADRVILLENGRITFSGAPQYSFTQYEAYRTQTARLFPNSGWFTSEEALKFLSSRS